MKLRHVVFSIVSFAVLLITSRASAQTQVAINTPLQNFNTKVVVVAFCNATKDPKDLEGWVGPNSPSTLIASLSGTGRQTITFIVPPNWQYKISVVVPVGGDCKATIWPD